MHPEALKLPYGRTVTFTFQPVDEDDERVSEEGVEIRVRSEEESDDRLIRRRTRTYYTSSSGEVVLRFRITESEAEDDDIDSYLDLEILASSDLDIEDESTVEILDSKRLPWSDEDEEPTTLILEQTVDYHSATNVGRGGRNTVTATLVDQYGDPVRGERIHFVSDDQDGLDRLDNAADEPEMAQTLYRKPTSRRGQAVVRYYRDSDTPGLETIEAFTEDDDIRSETLEHYWVDEVPDDGVTYGYEVIDHDEDRNTLVLPGSDNMRLRDFVGFGRCCRCGGHVTRTPLAA